MTVSRDNCFVYSVDMLHQVLDFCTIFIRQTIACGIRNVYYRSSCLDDCFDYACQIFIVRTSGIFCVKFHVIYVTSCIFHGSYCTFNNFFTGRIEFILDMRIRSTDSRMNTFMFGILQGFCRYINIFLHSTSQRTDSRPSHRFRNFNYRIKISRT